jgi:hypothetical protein
MAKVADSHQPDPLGRVIALGAEGVYFYDQLIMPPAGCPPLPQVRNPRPGPHPLSLLRLLVHFPTSLNQLCHCPLLRPQTVVPLTSAGLPDMHLHLIRKAFGGPMLASGVDLATVSALLGHSSVSLTASTYAGVMPSLKQDAADRLGRLLESDPPGGD